MSDLEELANDIAEQEEAPAAETLSRLGLEALALDADIKGLEETLKEQKRKLAVYLERLIPEAMAEQDVPEFGFTTPDGGVARLSVGTELVGSLSRAPDIEAAVAYLEETGMEGGVKTVVSVDFTEEQRREADALGESIHAATGKTPNFQRSINAGTLKAFAKTAMEKDPSWDFARVGLVALRKAKFTKR